MVVVATAEAGNTAPQELRVPLAIDVKGITRPTSPRDAGT